MRKIIIGLGSGRCGTYSLNLLLNHQENTFCTHEGRTVPFSMDEKRGVGKIIEMLLCPEIIVGDIGYYWLNYVPFLIAFVGEIKFICLQRDRESTVESFCKKKFHNNFMVSKDSEHYDPEDSEYDMSGSNFPTYDLPKKEAVSKYYDDYYTIAEQWQESYPYNFGIFKTSDLNSDQRNILEFAGFEDPVLSTLKRGNALNSMVIETVPIDKRMVELYNTRCGVCKSPASKQIVSKTHNLTQHICSNCIDKSIHGMLKKTNMNDFTLLENPHV